VGLARLTPAVGEAISALTASGALVGTADYIAPEQARDARRADARSDVYSLGCTLHFLLTGRPPFGGKSRAERVLAHAERPIPSLSGQRADVPPALDVLFRKMLAKDPADRPQSMEEVLHGLEACRPPEGGAKGRAAP
jgi:serine/threonine protein kinase